MKRWKKLLFIVIFFFHNSFSTPQILDKIVAIVNDEIILKSDIDTLIQFMKINENHIDQGSDDIRTYHQILDRLIMEKIILQIGKKIGIKIPDKQINLIMMNIAKQNNMNLNQMKNHLMRNGFNYSEYRNQIYKEILVSKIYNNEVRRRIIISNKEIETIMKKIKNHINDNLEFELSHMFIPLPEKPTLNQIKKTENFAYFIIKQARNGKNFEKLATNYSINNQKIKISKLGWNRIQDLPSIFAEALSTLNKNDITIPIRSNIGFHILKVNNFRKQNKNFFVNEVHISHILMKPSIIISDNQVRKKLEQIAINIKNGKITFSNAAKKFSEDSISANQHGDLGWVQLNIYEKTIRDALAKLKKGQVSMPVRSSSGWHLIKLLNTRNVKNIDVEEKNQAYQIIFDRKFSEEAAIWIQEQRNNSYVKILKNS